MVTDGVGPERTGSFKILPKDNLPNTIVFKLWRCLAEVKALSIFSLN
jgi:hypothetical protein